MLDVVVRIVLTYFRKSCDCIHCSMMWEDYSIHVAIPPENKAQNAYSGKRLIVSLNELGSNIRHYALLCQFVHEKRGTDPSAIQEGLKSCTILDIDANFEGVVKNGLPLLHGDGPLVYKNTSEVKQQWKRIVEENMYSVDDLVQASPVFADATERTNKLVKALADKNVDHFVYYTGCKGYRILFYAENMWRYIVGRKDKGHEIVEDSIIPYFRSLGLESVDVSWFDCGIYELNKGVKTDLTRHPDTGFLPTAKFDIPLCEIDSDNECRDAILRYWKHVVDTLPEWKNRMNIAIDCKKNSITNIPSNKNVSLACATTVNTTTSITEEITSYIVGDDEKIDDEKIPPTQQSKNGYQKFSVPEHIKQTIIKALNRRYPEASFKTLEASLKAKPSSKKLKNIQEHIKNKNAKIMQGISYSLKNNSTYCPLGKRNHSSPGKTFISISLGGFKISCQSNNCTNEHHDLRNLFTSDELSVLYPKPKVIVKRKRWDTDDSDSEPVLSDDSNHPIEPKKPKHVMHTDASQGSENKMYFHITN